MHEDRDLEGAPVSAGPAAADVRAHPARLFHLDVRTLVRVCQRLRGLQANRKSMTIGLPAAMPSSYEIKVPKPYGFGTFFGSGRRIRIGW